MAMHVEENLIESKVLLATDTLKKITGDDDDDYGHAQLAVTLLISAAREYAEESRWIRAAELVRMLLPHIDVIKKHKRKQLLNFCAIVLLYVGDKQCVECQEEAIKLYMREMEFKRAAREAENFASVLMEKEDYINALQFYKRAADIMERDDRHDEAFLMRVMKITRLQVRLELFGEAADMAESITASSPHIDDSSRSELLYLSSLLRFLDLMKRGQDFGELRTNFCVLQLAESFQERFIMIQNLICAVQSANCVAVERQLECMKDDEYGVVSAVRKWTLLRTL